VRGNAIAISRIAGGLGEGGPDVRRWDIKGNRTLIEPGVTGLPFRDEGEFEEGTARLAGDPKQRRKLGRAGRGPVADFPAPARESNHTSTSIERPSSPLLTEAA
jgi:hypothetical protein